MAHMRIRIPATAIGLLLLALSAVGLSDETTQPPPAARDTPQGELHNAVASVIYPNRIDPMRLILNTDGTLSESMKGSGVTEWVWGPTAPKSIANQRDSHRYDFEVPGKDVPEPKQGTWKERK